MIKLRTSFQDMQLEMEEVFLVGVFEEIFLDSLARAQQRVLLKSRTLKKRRKKEFA